jgi:hypothetical protein
MQRRNVCHLGTGLERSYIMVVGDGEYGTICNGKAQRRTTTAVISAGSWGHKRQTRWPRKRSQTAGASTGSAQKGELGDLLAWLRGGEDNAGAFSGPPKAQRLRSRQVESGHVTPASAASPGIFVRLQRLGLAPAGADFPPCESMASPTPHKLGSLQLSGLHARREDKQITRQRMDVCYDVLDESESHDHFVCSSLSLTAYKRSACKGLKSQFSSSRFNPNIRASLPDIAKLPLPLYHPAVAVLNPMVPHPTTSNDWYPWIYYSVNFHSAGTEHRLFLTSVRKSRATRLRLFPSDLPCTEIRSRNYPPREAVFAQGIQCSL